MPTFNFASFGVALIAVLMLLFGMVLGTKIGSELAKNCINHKDYWIAHLKILVIGVVISAFVCWLNLIVLAGIPIGAMASAITVLKMDFGESSVEKPSKAVVVQKRYVVLCAIIPICPNI